MENVLLIFIGSLATLLFGLFLVQAYNWYLDDQRLRFEMAYNRAQINRLVDSLC
jgi:hypothetical protein